MVENEILKTIEPILFKWIGFKSNGSVDLNHSEKILIDNVYKRIFSKPLDKKGFCYYCPEDVAQAFTKTFTYYEASIQNEPEKKKRPRIKDTQGVL